MAITSEEKKRRQAVLEKEKLSVTKLNDLSEIRERIRRNKDLNNQEVEEAEGSKRKIAGPQSDSDKSL